MIFVILLLTISNVKTINSYVPTAVQDVVNCICDIIETNFTKPGFLIFPHSNNITSLIERIQNKVLKKIHLTNKYSVRITGPDHKAICIDGSKTNYKLPHVDRFEIMAIAQYFVIIIESYDDFTYLARKFVRSRSWNPRAKFVIYLHRTSKSMNDPDFKRYLENIFSCLFIYNVVNVIIMVPHERIARNIIIYSWKPYDPPQYCGHYNETAKNRLIKESVCGHGTVRKQGNMFKERIPSNMQGCKIHVLAIEKQPFISKNKKDPNMENRLVTRLLGRLNISVNLEIINEFRGERDEKGKWQGALGHLMERKGEILLGGIFPDYEVHEDFECSTTYMADSYTWVVPRAYPSPAWSSLTAAFENPVWFTATVVFITCVFIWKILAVLSGDTKYNRTFRHCFLSSWLIVLGFPAYIQPMKESLRIFYVFLILNCLLFMTAYQTKLIDVLQNPTFGSQIKTVQDLVQSGLKFGGLEELQDLFYNSTDPFEFMIGEKWINENNMSKALLDVAINRNFSVFCSRLELAHLSAVLQDLSDSFGRNKYYAFEISAFVVPLEMIALKGFPFMKTISRTLSLYKQIGLNEFARRVFANLNKKRRAKLLRSINIQRNYYKPLTINHLYCGFFVLLLGMCSGIITLIMEIIFYRLLNRNI